MGHYIQAIIGAPEVVARARGLGLLDPPIALDAGLAWVPVVDVRLDELAETSRLPQVDFDRRLMLHGGVLPAILTEISRHGPVAYVETAYHGGIGDQAATAYDGGVRVLEFGTVNQALRAIGVRARWGLDEWDTAGLGKHRGMPDD